MARCFYILLVFLSFFSSYGCQWLENKSVVRSEIEPPPDGINESSPPSITAGSTLPGDSSTDGTNSSTATDPETSIVIEIGDDVSAKAAFTMSATVVQGTPTIYLWEKVSGPGSVIFGTSNASSTTISVDADGTYVIKLTASTASGESGSDTFTLVWDNTGPTKPEGLITAADSAAGPNVVADNDLTVYFVWTASSDGAGSGVKDYTVTWYAQESCAGGGTDIQNVLQTSYEFTGVNGSKYSFKVRAFDHAGNVSTGSDCSGSITIDMTPPPSLTSFVGAVGTSVATTKLTITPPDDPDIDHIDIRRVSGGTAPSDCSAGTVVRTFTSGALPDGTSILDDTEVADALFSYRACVYDLAGNVTSNNTTDIAEGITSKKHYIYITATARTGSLGGLAGADSICNASAGGWTLIGTEEAYWKAILSDSTLDAKDRISIRGKVLTLDQYSEIATNEVDFWNGMPDIAQPVFPNETVDPIIGYPASLMWTGSTNAGIKPTPAHNCLNWTNDTVGNLGNVGDNLGNADSYLKWLYDSVTVTATCNTTLRIYCISQYNTELKVFSGITSSNAGGNITLTIQPPTDFARVTSIVISRITGDTPPDSACSNGTTVTSFVPANSASFEYEDDTGQANTEFSYRACVTDKYNKKHTAKSITSVYSSN